MPGCLARGHKQKRSAVNSMQFCFGLHSCWLGIFGYQCSTRAEKREEEGQQRSSHAGLPPESVSGACYDRQSLEIAYYL